MIPLMLAAAITAAAPTDADLVLRTRAFLDAYAGDRVEQVMSMVDPEDLAIYGSDSAEFCGNVACLRQMMADDFQLWKTARFGAMTEVTVRRDSSLASIFLQVPFSAGGAPGVPVRISLVWRRRGGRWLLTQASNVVPTVGSSARQLLTAPSARPPNQAPPSTSP